MKRRSFLRNTGLGTAGLTLMPSLVKGMGSIRSQGRSHTGLVTAKPVDHGRALVNPWMGYTGYYYSHYLEIYGARLEPSDALQSFPGESVVYLRVTWAQLEPEEGIFNWTLLDTPAQ